MVTKVSSVSYPVETVTEKSSSSTPTPVTTSDIKTVTATRTRDGVRLPHWHDIIVAGGNATTAMSAVFDRCYFERSHAELTGGYPFIPGSWVKKSFSGYVSRTLSSTRVPHDPSMSITNAENRARAKWYSKLREIEVQFSAPTFFGELRQTLQQFRRPLAALHSHAHGYLDALSKAKRASPKHWVKTISGLWLEKVFGWDPLLHDIEDAYEAYQRALYKLVTSRVVSASYKDYADRTSSLTSVDRSTTLQNVNGVGIYTRWNGLLTEYCQIRYKGRVDLDVEATKWDNLALFGFKPNEFIPTAWELLPWSFLADYFVNIGDILTASVTSTRGVAYANKTVRRSTFYQGSGVIDSAFSLAAVGAGFVGYCGGSLGKWELERKTVVRSSGSGVPMPTLQFSLGLSDKQLFNIAALLGQARALHPQNYHSSMHFRGHG